MTEAYLSLGANLGAAAQTLRQAIDAIAQDPQIRIKDESSLYSSSPVDSHGPDYVNAALRIETSYRAKDLLHAMQALENAFGRVRPYKNAPRTLDIDILLFGQLQSHDPELILPHPRMHERAFVLQPLQEIEPRLVLAQGDLTSLLKQAIAAGQTIYKLSPAPKKKQCLV
ncbi:2-amino-4-hydroxy-6-hydroxymethyldihydropteridine diphosphokinase [Brackiella oedipodis]|uniref:2-amino-4-hydroxy-6- hydroxymethyldihydropteridine diphosphokinase n=1 Tax=Brackiella oedipodis TaxID=124225 RepID=UPI000688BACA|nr:2-amino-4-hydroxy-6-hydroxymethyldihydropteridine diphosphokinase [Brackiella oedipodis]